MPLSALFILQAPKKEKKEEDEEDQAFKEKKKAEAALLKEAREKGMYFSSQCNRGSERFAAALKGMF